MIVKSPNQTLDTNCRPVAPLDTWGQLGRASNGHASQEESLRLSSFRLESNGTDSSGRVSVEGKQTDQGQIVTLTIAAFGKNYVVPQEKLSQLADLRPNGVRISYEAGYKGLGGRAVYLELQCGSTSGTLSDVSRRAAQKRDSL